MDCQVYCWILNTLHILNILFIVYTPIYCACSCDMLRHLNKFMHKLFNAEMGTYCVVTKEVFIVVFIITIMDTHPPLYYKCAFFLRKKKGVVLWHRCNLCIYCSSSESDVYSDIMYAHAFLKQKEDFRILSFVCHILYTVICRIQLAVKCKPDLLVRLCIKYINIRKYVFYIKK